MMEVQAIFFHHFLAMSIATIGARGIRHVL